MEISPALKRFYERLKGTQLFHGLEDAELGQILVIAEKHEYEPGIKLFDQGDASESIIILISGKLEVRSTDEVLADVSEYEVVGEMGVFTESARSATVFSTEKSVVLKIPGAELIALMNTHVEIGFKLYRNAIQIVAGYLKKNNLLLEFYGSIV